MTQDSFSKRVVKIALSITRGKVTTALYKKEGIKLGKTDRIIDFKDVLI